MKHPRLRLVAQQSAPELAPASSRPTDVDDNALLAGVAAGDAQHAQSFCKRVRPIVDRTLARLLGASDPDYEDLAQVALFELVDTIHRFRRDCPLDAWLSIVTARVVYRHIRRRRLERSIFSQLSRDDTEGQVVVLPVALEIRQAIERVTGLLSEMDPKRVWTWLLHDVYGYDLKEITEIMGVSLSAAQSRLVRGRRDVHDRVRADAALAHYFTEFERQPS
jgi:RNA polymerase sigma-70 factor, ECF subfamily